MIFINALSSVFHLMAFSLRGLILFDFSAKIFMIKLKKSYFVLMRLVAFVVFFFIF